MKGFSSKERKIKIAKSIAASLAVGISIFYITPQAYANTAPANTTLPSGSSPMSGVNIDPNGNVMNINQGSLHDAYIKWQDFSIGANATVNFKGDISGYNMLNYVTGSSASQIYGRMNANNNGNIYVVNPNGVQIGKSAQINVGSLYVSNQNLDKVDFSNFKTVQDTINSQNAQRTNAELMSLGNINADKVTFYGDRVVIDVDRVTTQNGASQIAPDKLIVTTSDENNVVLGYSAYDDKNNTYAGKNNTTDGLATVNGNTYAKDKGYMWVNNLEQLQAMNTNTSGNYALGNSIDAIPTKDWDRNNDGTKHGFQSIGTGKDANGADIQAFSGKFDGLNNNIFGLTINRSDENNIGLFGSTKGATIKNVNLVNGSITGGNNVGAVVGNAQNTTIENVVSSAKVTGKENIGGIAGSADGTALTNVINTGTVEGHANVGGLAGSMADTDTTNEYKSQINGNSYNLGAIHGGQFDTNSGKFTLDAADANDLSKNNSHNIGGLVGFARNTTLGDGKTQIFNGMTVQGGYNVGGIVGNMQDSTVQNAANNADITATGYTSETYYYHGNKNEGKNPGEKTISDVNIANAGGIAGNVTGSKIDNVINNADVQSIEITKDGDTFYIAGNVGGVAGRVENTNISNAENKENEIRGAHNVGGIAGYFGGTWDANADKSQMYKISDSINNGGDIMATGARNKDYKALTENVTFTYSSDEKNPVAAVIVGNIGGIAGYMYGDNTQIADSANRGTVHSKDIPEGTVESKIQDSSKAANAGGVVGKIDRADTISIEELKKDATNAAVVDSYNTGSVRGFANLGGVAGMMYNGEVVRSYNAGNIRSTRTPERGTYVPVNMGGIVGDSTENVSAAHISLYDVYNRGDLGDAEFKFGARHVGGIVGRLSGDIDTAYNKGNIYNTMIVNGGIAGWWTSVGDISGSINNAFNTGNITIKNINNTGDSSGIGGLVGATGQSTGATGSLTISNAYNLGIVRSFDTSHSQKNYVGGIVGTVNHNTKSLIIDKVYTTGELYTASIDGDNVSEQSNTRSIYGNTDHSGQQPTITNAYYIKPKDNSGFTAVNDNQAAKIDYADRHNAGSYSGLFTGDTNANDISGDWRIYDGTTPILNAFLPKLAEGGNLNDKTNVDLNAGDKVQYGNAYNPFATIITTTGNKEITVNDKDAGAIGNVDSVIVRNGSLTVNNAANTGNTMYSGTLYADGAMTLNGAEGANISLGSISNLYGSTVTVNADGDLKAYGNIISTGQNGDNSVTINTTNGGNIEILGTVKSADANESIAIDGMKNSADDKTVTEDKVKDPNAVMPEVGEQYSFTVTNTAKDGGDIKITAGKDDKGNVGKVDILYGNLGKGYINSSGDVTVTGSEVYMDSDLNIGGDLTINADTSVLDISNVGKTKAAEKGGTQKDYLHGEGNFLSHFTNGNSINFNTTAGKNDKVDAMIAVDMWDYEQGQFDLTKFDAPDKSHLFTEDLNNLKLNGTNEKGEILTGRNTTYIWVGSGEQLAGIQQYKDNINKGSGILSFSFALKNDIDASQIGNDYKSIGTIDKDGKGTAFTGVFDGRDNRIIGLDTTGNTAGSNALFGTIGSGGTVKDIKVYSFTVQDDGVIAKTNSGTIDGISAFGNAVSGTGSVGGIVGTNTNSGTVQNTTSASVVVNTSADSKDSPVSIGGIAGTNAGTITNTESNSAVTSDTSLGEKSALGGIAGNNSGTIENVVSKGVTTGLYNNNTDGDYSSFKTAGNVGGIAGINTSKVNSAYNESIVSGMKNVGGVVGSNSGTIENLANATNVYGGDNVGGIAGSNDGTLTNGRNNGEIFGGKNITDENGSKSGGTNVGGLVGVSGEGSSMSNLTNDMSASITGHTNVGGLIGLNKGTFTDGQNLMNRGVISGVSNVGGSIGVNDTTGKVSNINTVNKSSIEVNTAYGDTKDSRYENFGGVIGFNSGQAENMSNSADVNLNNATAVQGTVNSLGGIIGNNTGTVSGVLLNGGNVTGDKNVGGIIGTNAKDISGAHLINGAVVHIDEDNITHWDAYDLKENRIKGNENVGGVIANNSGSINKTDVVNTVKGAVEGNINVGGLFGTNSGIVTGGRDDNGNYYKYHIVNNGTVTGMDTNAGGLVGINTGSLTAGYNTGSVTGKDNIGGVAGSNSGIIDQVFSNTESVTGTSNVGGVVGVNDTNGKLTNSYSIGIKKAVGNSNIAVENGIYADKDNYVFGAANEDGVKDGMNWLEESTDKDGKPIWKVQEGLAGPMLKVFLTKLVYHEKDGATADFPYDGNLHGFTIVINKDKNIAEVHKDGEMIGYLAAADGSGIHSLKDYFDTAGSGSDLISSNSQSEVGEYEMFFSHQINTSKADTPNKLGYEFVQGSSYDPGNTDDPKNPGGDEFDPNDPINPGTDVPKYEIIDNPGWEDGRWEYLFDDNPWGRKRNFRERKAEFNYQQGGTEIDETDEGEADAEPKAEA